MRLPIAYLSFLSLLVTVPSHAKPGVAERRKQLDALLAEEWEHRLAAHPVYATILGDKRWNDKLNDFSQAQIDREQAAAKSFLARFQAIDTSGFPDEEALNKTLMVYDLKLKVDAARFKDWEMPVDQMDGDHIDMPQDVALFPFDGVKDYEDYLARLGQIPRLLDENVVQMRKGMADGLMPPKLIAEMIVAQAADIGGKAPADSPFAVPTTTFPAAVPAADQARLRDLILDAIKTKVNPAYVRFAAFVRDEYAPKGRTEPGIWSLPDGNLRYRAAIQRGTSTSMAPEAIHQLGVAQVAAIEAEMLQIAHKLGHADLKSLNAAIAKEPRLHAHSREEILAEYRKYTAQMYARLPELFGRLPKAKLEVRPIEEFNEKTASTHYDAATPDGSRPGHVMVNTGDFEHRLLISDESTAYHEGVPGHHMQVTIAEELTGLPAFRQHADYNAYGEGWALYSERLGKDIGFYQDPYSDYGRLQDSMLRAIRLVVDTGFHFKHWSRQQVVDYFHAHSNIDEPDVQSETDRYISWPGQALGYKIGQLTIMRLRDEAQKALGSHFDIKAFHDEVLGAGALPIDVLVDRMHAWTAAQKKKAAGG